MGQPDARHPLKARTARAATMMMAPDQMLLQYIAAVMETFASRMNGEMISQTPASRLAACRLSARRAPVMVSRPRAARAAGSPSIVLRYKCKS
jgi:hypothetical protein